MSFYRSILAVLILVLVAGCSDISVRGLSESEYDQLAAIDVVDTGGRDGQLYSRRLRERLSMNDGAAPVYQLTSTISASSISTLSVIGSSSKLTKMTMTARFDLTNIATGDVELSDTISTNATLGAVSSYFGKDESEANGKERLAKLLADRVARRIQLFLLDASD